MTLTEGEKLLKSILNTTPHGIVALKAVRNTKGGIEDFQVQLINAEGLNILGRSAEDIEGAGFLESFPGQVTNALFDSLKEVVETGERLKREVQFRRGQESLWYSIHATRFADGLTISFVDVSEEKQHALELGQSEAKYRQLFEESMDSIFLMNNEYLILESNASMLQLFGYDQKEIRFLSLSELFSDEETFWHFNKQLYKNNKVEEFEAEMRMANGQTVVCLINLVALEKSQAQVGLYQGVIKDISKRKQAEAELLLAEKLSMTGKIARSIAHEVRNPLTNLSLALEQLKDEVPEHLEDAELYFNIIGRNARRIEELISGLLESSKPKALSLENSQVNEVVKAAVQMVEDRINLQQMKLELQLHEGLPAVALDKDQMKMALVNLMINAIEAMKAGEGVLRVSTLQQQQHILIHIEDNGKGISKENQKKLFDPFFTAKKGGMGLGLTSVQNIVQSHLGEIKVTSEEDQGTRFTISIAL
ncbi:MULTISPECIES: ATP-binding protein [unclassified Roseivirga]|jgi:PAS domain S-box-containing protein|uniref:PAS domain-containing sensor histidine kinase n=1 Tax=unclassified Roseivirga TaxID=2626142 RepID=UPI002579DAA3|nr:MULTISPECIES: ATP-binding protein [unclassified Roseivirga]MEC7754558.1 ATP-binding protein [Bacteroidota bacterium]|tara:strand:+ start:1381 stop:2814 length:1434 start_codon:yes stop_codon:yes gene_type:complete